MKRETRNAKRVPLGPETYSPGKCTRVIDGPLDNPTAFCLKDAVLHVFWEGPGGDNGFVCSEHSAEISQWSPYSVHVPEVPPCGHTGSYFAWVKMSDGTTESWCYLEVGERELSAAAVTEVVA